MKKYLLLLLCIVCLQIQLKAQIGISATNSPPNASAMLDVSSTTKGLLPPRMTSVQRGNIPTPANGLLVFDSDTQSYWFRQSGAWTELPKGGSTNNYWQLNGIGGNEITNTNSGGFWSANPTQVPTYATLSAYPKTAPISGSGTRIMWIPSQGAFRVGTVSTSNWDASNIGYHSFASGLDTKATNNFSTAMGNNTTASGQSSFAVGQGTTASGFFGATAMGYNTIASGNIAFATGNQCVASSTGSFATGFLTTASGLYSTAMGSYASTNNKELSFAIAGTSTTNRATNDRDYQMKMHFDEFQFLTGANNNFTINDVWVSTSNSLFVYGNRNYNLGGYGYLNNTAPTGLAPSATIPVSIYSAGRIAASEFDAFSDARHKKLRSYSNGKTDLSLLNQLKVSNYTFIDTVGKGTKMQMGFIAQQVEEIVPEAVNRIQDYIPSVYDMAKSMVYDANAHTLMVSTNKPHDFHTKDEIKLISLDKEHKVKVDKIIDANTFVVSNWEKSVDKIFVFGKRVDDFRTVDYDRLFTLGISSIQELSRRVEQLEKENVGLKSESKVFNQMKSELAELRAMIIK